MATQLLAQAHSHPSNRARVRSVLERKPVFKSVLENPFRISWPSVPVNVQNVVLARLAAALENIPSRAHASQKSLQKTGITVANITEGVTHGSIQTIAPLANQASAEPEDYQSGVSQHLVIGINVVTRELESQLHATRKRIVVGNHLSQKCDQPPPLPKSSPITAVFVCHADVDPSALVDHIPYLVAGCNSPGNAMQPIKLVPLPRGSETSLSRILGVRRAAVVAFRHGSPLSEIVQDILDSVPIVSAPWFRPSDAQGPPQLVPTHIKQIRTTAPKDMRGAREERLKARAAARRNVSNSSWAGRRKPRVTLTTG